MLRVLHFSDVHVDVPWRQMPWKQMANKRLLGAANLILRRGRRFEHAREKLAALARFASEQRIDVAVCTGDYTALGTEPELRAARAAVDPLTLAPLGFVTVPGNHDVYVPDAVENRNFERVFGDLLRTDWPEHVVDEWWPSVRLFGDQLAVVAVNSARPNPQPWRSSGRIPDGQLDALGTVLRDPRLMSRVVLVATHYAPRRRGGSPDHRLHGLENAEELIAACRTHPQTAILHGHIHWRYHVDLGHPPAIFGAGSATDAGREGIWLFEVTAGSLRAVPGAWGGKGYVLDAGRAVAPWG